MMSFKVKMNPNLAHTPHHIHCAAFFSHEINRLIGKVKKLQTLLNTGLVVTDICNSVGSISPMRNRVKALLKVGIEYTSLLVLLS